MSTYDFPEDDEPGFFQKYGLVIAMGIVFLFAGGLALGCYVFAGKIPPPKKPEEIMVHLLPPPPLPPPPPPPKLPPPPPEQKMVEQPPIKPNEAKPKAEAKSDKPPGPPGPAATGPASDFGLGGGGGGGGIGGDGDGGGSKFGWYASSVVSSVHDALLKNEKTKVASIRIKVRIWVGSDGRVSRAALSGSTGDASIDDALQNQVLTGLNLPEAPPSDMPMPIVMMINEARPN